MIRYMLHPSNTSNVGKQAQRTARPVPAKARELLNDQPNGLPIWIRPPKQRINDGHSRSASIRKRPKYRIKCGVGNGEKSVFNLQVQTSFGWADWLAAGKRWLRFIMWLWLILHCHVG